MSLDLSIAISEYLFYKIRFGYYFYRGWFAFAKASLAHVKLIKSITYV
jgi:hypothetical protein